MDPEDHDDDNDNQPEATVPLLLPLQGDQVLTGHAYGDATIEWDWNRLANMAGLQDQKDHKYLASSWTTFQSEFQNAEVPIKELHYRGIDAMKQDQLTHTMSSRATILMLALIPTRKRFAAATKVMTLKLLAAIINCSCRTMVAAAGWWATIFGTDQMWHQHYISFNQAGVSHDADQLFNCNTEMQSMWQALMARTWAGHTIQTPCGHPSLFDVLFFLIWAKCHKESNNVWQHCAVHLWPKAIHFIGSLLHNTGLQIASNISQGNQQLQPAPVLKSRKGKPRRIPMVNRLVLLQKCNAAKRHRVAAMQTHTDIVPGNANIVKHEQVIRVAIYTQKIAQAFKDCRHIAVSWDPSTYDVECMVAIAYSHQADIAAYLPIQVMQPLRSQDIHEDLRAFVGKLTRLDGFSEMKALSNALRAIGAPLDQFNLPANWYIKKLQPHQKRITTGGKVWIQDMRSQTLQQAIPTGIDMNVQPLLVSISDQGGINRAALDYCQFKLGQLLLVQFDSSHRIWNDIKAILKLKHQGTSQSTLWKTMLSTSLFYNINYGPSGSKAWFQKKKLQLDEFTSTIQCDQEPFLTYLPYICQERQIPEPMDHQGRHQIWETIPRMNNVNVLGPLTKLMRWWSWFQCYHHFDGECYATKMLMLAAIGPDQGVPEDNNSKQDTKDALKQQQSNQKLTDKEEIAKLKAKHGSYKLAAMMINPKTMFEKDLIYEVCRPIWSLHTHCTQNVVTPLQHAEYQCQLTMGGWKDELVQLLQNSFQSTKLFRKLFPDCLHERLPALFSFATKLVAKRGLSLASVSLRPPLRYNGLLLPQHQWSTVSTMNQEWQHLLVLESQQEAGANIQPLEQCHFLFNSWVRLQYHLNEEAYNTGQPSAQTQLMQQVATQHFGDSRIIENAHQGAKDILRDARHNVRSTTHKMGAVISCQALPQRKTNHIQVTDQEVANATLKSLPPFVPLTQPAKHHLTKEFHQVMQHKAGQHWWPSTSAQSLFNEVCALEWLMHHRGITPPDQPTQGINHAVLTCLVGQPGQVVASQKQGVICMVLSMGATAFLACHLEVLTSTKGQMEFQLPPQLHHCHLKFHHVSSIDEWLNVPCSPKLANSYGPMILQQIAAPLPLPAARIHEGLALTVSQIQQCMAILGSPLPKQIAKVDAYAKFIAAFVTDEEKRKAAMDHSKCNKPDEADGQEEDEDYQELLDMVEDAENTKDPEIMEEKKKSKQERIKGWLTKPRKPREEAKVGAKAKGRGMPGVEAGAVTQAKAREKANRNCLLVLEKESTTQNQQWVMKMQSQTAQTTNSLQQKHQMSTCLQQLAWLPKKQHICHQQQLYQKQHPQCQQTPQTLQTLKHQQHQQQLYHNHLLLPKQLAYYFVFVQLSPMFVANCAGDS